MTNDIFIIISNKDEYDWTRLIDIATITNDEEPDIIGIDTKGNIDCVYNNAAIPNRQVYVINEDMTADRIKTYLANLLDLYDNKRMLVAVHNRVRHKAENYLITQSIPWIPFRHEDRDVLWNQYVQPYINAIVTDGDASGRCLEKLLSYGRIEIIHSLRADILDIFMPLYFAYQNREGTVSTYWDTLIEDCKRELGSALLEKLAEVIKLANCSDVSFENEIKNSLERAITLAQATQCDEPEKQKDLVRLIVKISGDLESLVRFAEFGDSISCC